MAQTAAMFTGLAFQNATNELHQGSYIGINVTNSSMSQLSPDVIALQDVPGYKLNIQCHPRTVTSVQIFEQPDNTL